MGIANSITNQKKQKMGNAMTSAANVLKNNNLVANTSHLVGRAGAKITGAIQQAAAKTGVDFAYLMQQASTESSFNAQAKAKTSSATGLFQFIDSTWLSMVDKYGEKYGLGDLAAKIGDNGKVASQSAKQEILNLRKDPKVASLMAAEYAAENKNFLESRLGQGTVGSTEMYLAHFMGAGGASSFLQAHRESPDTPAAVLFPQAAKANSNIFYDKATGKQKTLDEIYAHFDKKFAGVGNSTDQIYKNTYPKDYTTDGPRQVAAPLKSMFIEETAQWVDIRPKGFFGPGAVARQMASMTNNLVNPLDVMSLAELEWPSDRKGSGRYNA